MFKRLAEKLLGLEPGYFNQPGELGRHWFDPHWPGPLFGTPGSWHNYLLALIVLALIVLLFRRFRSQRWINQQDAVAAGLATAVCLIFLGAFGVHAWTLIPALFVLGLLAYFLFTRRWRAVLILGRLMLFALLLSFLSGALAWNVTLGIAGALLIVWVYRHEGRSRPARISLGILRGALAAFVLILLNNPILSRVITITQPSVVAVLVDHSLSMSIHDVDAKPGNSGPSRLESAVNLLDGQNQALLKRLGSVHTLHFYSFDSSPRPLGDYTEPKESEKSSSADGKPSDQEKANQSLIRALQQIKADGAATQVVPSILTVLDDLQGQRLAGIVVLTDGRDTPTAPLAEAYHALANFGIKVFPISVGSEAAPKNVELTSVSVQDSAFKDDIVDVRFTLRATGFEPGHPVRVKLIDKKTKLPLRDMDDKPAEKIIHVADSNPIEDEILFKPDHVGPLDIQVEAEKQPGEIDEQDNIRLAQTSILDASINVLYVEGYPRWEYRYIKNEMIRDKTVNISCLLVSADPTFLQEGDDPIPSSGPDAGSKFPGRITRFPETMEELMLYDVVLFGDVDPREFTDTQLQLIQEFVAKKGGGFGMIAGEHWSPIAYRNTPIDLLLPVNTATVKPDPPDEEIADGFRPILTKQGAESSIFRFFAERKDNENYIKNQLQPLFWYCRGVTVKPGVGEVYAEHPFDIGPDGRKSPLLVVGRFGSGRTLFSAYDDSWRWRFYTGESIFDTYWVQQLRYLARSKKLGQRKLTFAADRQTYQQGEPIRLALRVLDPKLLQELPPEIPVQMLDENGMTVRAEKLQKEGGQGDYYTTAFVADRLGRFTMRLPASVGEADVLDLPVEIIVPRLELADPQVNKTGLSRIAAETGGQSLTVDSARAQLPTLLQSAARTVALVFSRPLWDKPLAMIIFVLLITTEWVLRKVYGMV